MFIHCVLAAAKRNLQASRWAIITLPRGTRRVIFAQAVVGFCGHRRLEERRGTTRLTNDSQISFAD